MNQTIHVFESKLNVKICSVLVIPDPSYFVPSELDSIRFASSEPVELIMKFKSV